jgi:uncharacterized membrane protein YcjF (UPF0283 family)
MFRPLARLLLSRIAIAVVDLLICVPMVAGILEVSKDLWVKPDLDDLTEIVLGLGVIMIGWGVVLEERYALREMFGLVGGPDEAWQAALDHNCHQAGVVQLVLGLFSEICIQSIRVPISLVHTGGLREWMVALGIALVAIGGIMQARHAARLLFMGKAR